MEGKTPSYNRRNTVWCIAVLVARDYMLIILRYYFFLLRVVVCGIGIGRFRIVGGQGLEYLGGGKGAKLYSRHMTSCAHKVF